MILKKLYIHNYKSFYDTTIELNKFNIIIGENNSGKSNIIDVLEFIDIAIEKDLSQAIIEKGGFEKVLNYNHNEDTILIELELEDGGLIKYRFKINQNISNILTKARTSSLSKSYAFNTQTIKDQSHKKFTNQLQKYGSNLGKNLFEIKQNYPHSFETISNSMIGIINEIDGIDVRETFGNYLIGFYERNQEIGIDMVSDGTINLLATMTALNQDEDKSILLAFDEPERYLHLKAVNYLLDSFRANEKQILITTHSTEILKDANLDEILFVYRDNDGDTQSIKASDIPDLEGKMQRLGYERPLSLDELIADGIVGDFE